MGWRTILTPRSEDLCGTVLNPVLRSAVLCAWARSGSGEEPVLSTRTLLWGLLEEKEATAAQLLAGLGLTPDALQAAFGQTVPQEGQDPAQNAGLTTEAREAINCAYQLAVEMEDNYVGGSTCCSRSCETPGTVTRAAP